MSKFLTVIFTFIFIIFGLWASAGLWFQFAHNSVLRFGLIICWLVACGLAIQLFWRKPTFITICSALILIIGYLIWWSTLQPSLSRVWASDVARTVTGEINGDIASLHNIRDFDWIDRDHAHEYWIDGDFDLTQIHDVTVYTSYWMGPWIAHTLVGFTFNDGRVVVFSAEIRREEDEKFSAIGGFFKQFELAMIAATERDIIRLRTTARGEDVYRYQLQITPQQARAIFESYIETANHLAQNASFYNTVTANCTTVIFDMVRALEPGIPMDWRILLSGKLPEYLYDHGFIDTHSSLEQTIMDAHIGAEAEGGRDNYSNRIRGL